MRTRVHKSLAAFVLLFTFLWQSAVPVAACGPFTLEPLFSFTKHPDYPLLNHTSKNYGIVPDTFGRSSLFGFYRALTENPLTDAELKAYTEMLQHRIDYVTPGESPTEVFKRWRNARAKVVGEQDEIVIELDKRVKDGDFYNFYPNCNADAITTAASTLEKRIAQHGPEKDNLREWLKGQDRVFANCDEGSTVPDPAPEGSPEWLRKDRDYQIAAANFYIPNSAEARTRFQAIAADASSPWRKTANYLVARTYVREASIEKEAQKAELLRKAEDHLNGILADPAMSEIHKASQRMLNLVKYRSNPEGRRAELAATLAGRGENENLQNDLTDYIWLLESIESDAENVGMERQQKEAEAQGKDYDYNYDLELRDIPEGRRSDDLTDWLFTYQSIDGYEHAVERYRATNGQHWLAAALVLAKKDSASVSDLLAAADRIRLDSPAGPTLRYHQIRLLQELGRTEESDRKVAEVFGPRFEQLPMSSRNKFLSMRLATAKNLAEFLRFAQRKPVTLVWSDDGNERGEDFSGKDPNFVDYQPDQKMKKWATLEMFDSDSVIVFNKVMPLSTLRAAALSSDVPEHLKKFLVIAVWTRAFVLGNKQVEAEFTPLMTRYAKEFSPTFSRYAGATGATEKEAAALLTVLRYPVIQPHVPAGYGRDADQPTSIDSNRGNWWCKEFEYQSGYFFVDEEDQKPMEVRFLTERERAQAKAEYAEIAAGGDSATYLTKRVLAFATANPGHSLTPELLHLAVRSTRYGCKDDGTGKYSKQAFDLLHKRYPKSPWTAKTPYWFN